MEPRRIIFLSGNGPGTYCGVSSFTEVLIKHLSLLRPEWSWIWISRRSHFFSFPIRVIGKAKVIQPSHRWGRGGTKFTAFVAGLLNPDVVCIQEEAYSFWESEAAVKFASILGRPTIAHIHDFHANQVSSKYTRDLVETSSIVISSGPHVTQKILNHTKKREILRGWTPTNMSPDKTPTQLLGNSNIISSFGLINQDKEYEATYEALSLLWNEGLRFEWRIIGPFNPDTSSLHHKLKKNIRAPWVTWVGPLDIPGPELQSELERATLMILPYSSGASPGHGSLQTAWAFGKPTITTLPLAPDATIENEKNCLIVNVKNTFEFSAAIKRLLTDHTLRETLLSGSLKTAELFSWKRLSELYMIAIEQSLGKH